MSEIIETIIVGGGQAGLATSYYLKQRGCEQVVLEQAAQAGNAWRNDRWDSFTLLTPNWSFRLPGAEYQGEGREGFMPRDEIVARFEQYVEGFHLPVRYGARVTSVEPAAGREGYRVGTGETVLHARNVVIASGLYQKPKKPPFSTTISSRITQVASGQYRNPQTLAEGAVLVVGSGQSGCQIAEELYLSGRKVYLCTGIAPRVPRRYRGKDIYEWFHLSGFLDRTTDQLASPAARFDANPQVTGRDGGRSLNLHQFARDGVALLGRLQGAREERAWLAPDLQQNLAKADQKEAEIVKMVDGYITRSGLDAPEETLPVLQDGYEQEETTELDLRAAGITTIIWAMGYSFDFSLVRLPVCDNYGYPLQKRGATDHPGLYFVGLPWLYKFKSGHLFGMGEDAEHIADAIAAK